MLIHEFVAHAQDDDGHPYRARAFGRARRDGTWVGWLEFTPIGGGVVRRTGRETTQPDRRGVLYWALGLEPVYLDGALVRAIRGPLMPSEESEADAAL